MDFDFDFNDIENENYVDDFCFNEDYGSIDEGSFNIEDRFSTLSITTLDQLKNEHGEIVRSGYENEHQCIVKYLTTGDPQYIIKAEIQFEFLPGMDTIPLDGEEPMKSGVLDIMSDFRRLLIKIRDSPPNNNNDLKFLHFPLLFHQKTRAKYVRKSKLMNQRTLDINNMVSEGRPDEAIELCISLMIDEPTNPQPLKILSFLYDDIGDIDNSLKFALSAALMSKNDPVQWHYMAMLFIKNSHLEKGIECLEQAFHKGAKYIPTYWAASCYLFLKKSYINVLCIVFSFLKYGISDFLDDHVMLVKKVVNVLKKIAPRKRIPMAIEVVLNNIHPYLDMELFNTYCQMMIKEKNYTSLFRAIFKLVKITKKNFDIIICEEIEWSTAQSVVEFISFLPHDIVACFIISLIHTYPKSASIANFLIYIKYLVIQPNLFIEIVDALCTTKNYPLALQTCFISTDFYVLNGGIRLDFIKYYIETDQMFEALNLSAYIQSKITPCYYELISAMIWKVLKIQDKSLSHFNVFYKKFCVDKRYQFKVRDILNLLICKMKDLGSSEFDICISMCTIVLFLYLQPEDILLSYHINVEDFKNIFHKIIIHFSQIPDPLYNDILSVFDIAMRQNTKDNEIFYTPILIHIKFLQISTNIKFGFFDEAFNHVCDLIAFNDENITNLASFWNLFVYIATNSVDIDRRRILRTVKGLKSSKMFEYCLISACISKCTNKTTFVLDKSLTACSLSSDSFLPYVIHAVHLFNTSTSKHVKDGWDATFQAFVFMATAFHLFRKNNLTAQGCYNLGRLFHGYGLYCYAENFYIKALNSPDDGFKKETAYNLALIYEHRKNRQLACNILKKYFTI